MGARLPTAPDVARRDDTLAHVPAEWTRIAGVSEPRRTVLYLHGGAYIVGSPVMYRGVVQDIARATCAEVVAIDYRLAPEHPFPAALDDAECSYTALLDRGVAPERLLVMGDSAGGNLTLALLERLRSRGLPAPAGAVTLSPWLDLAADYTPQLVHEARDPMLPAERIREAAALYHRTHDPRHPEISPAYADPRGWPPVLMHAGTRELLLPAICAFAARGRAQGADLELEVWPHMPHVFQAFAKVLPEARMALASIGRFAVRRVP